MKLTEKEKASLQVFEGRKGKYLYALIIFVPIFFTVMAIANLYLAHKIGMYEGISITCLFNDWIEGVDINQTYSFSGIYYKAQERFSTALLLILGAVVTGVNVIIIIKDRTRNRKIIEILKKHKVKLPAYKAGHQNNY